MIQLWPEQLALLGDWFRPERPGPLVGPHALLTGQGVAWADRWPLPRALLVEVAGNYALAGDPAALSPTDLASRVSGFVDAPEAFLPLLWAACPGLVVWDRVILELHDAPRASPAIGPLVRRLEPGDAPGLLGLGAETAWVAKTWGGPAGLALSGHAWGAFVDGQPRSVACTFFLGFQSEEVGVATEPDFRGRGLSTACALALCRDIQARGHWPSWSTSPDNLPSLRVAEKLGFVLQRRDRLYVAGVPVPT